MHIIGITGGVGAGKSEIIKYLSEHYGVDIAKADEIGHLGLQQDSVCYSHIIDLLGSDIIDEGGLLNREKISAIVHADKEKLTHLDAILHPFVKQCIIKMIIDARELGKQYFFIEAALLLEDNYDQICDEVWYIYAKNDIRCGRLSKSRGYSKEKINQIMANQLTEDEFRNKCDFVIDNSDEFVKTIKQIDSRMQKYEIM